MPAGRSLLGHLQQLRRSILQAGEAPASSVNPCSAVAWGAAFRSAQTEFPRLSSFIIPGDAVRGRPRESRRPGRICRRRRQVHQRSRERRDLLIGPPAHPSRVDLKLIKYCTFFTVVWPQNVGSKIVFFLLLRLTCDNKLEFNALFQKKNIEKYQRKEVAQFV